MKTASTGAARARLASARPDFHLALSQVTGADVLIRCAIDFGHDGPERIDAIRDFLTRALQAIDGPAEPPQLLLTDTEIDAEALEIAGAFIDPCSEDPEAPPLADATMADARCLVRAGIFRGLELAQAGVSIAEFLVGLAIATIVAMVLTTSIVGMVRLEPVPQAKETLR